MGRCIKDKWEDSKGWKDKKERNETKRRDRIAYRQKKGLGFIDLSGRGRSTAYQSITLSVPFAEDHINLI